MGIDGNSGNHESFHMCIVYSCRQAMINHLMLKKNGVLFAGDGAVWSGWVSIFPT